MLLSPFLVITWEWALDFLLILPSFVFKLLNIIKHRCPQGLKQVVWFASFSGLAALAIGEFFFFFFFFFLFLNRIRLIVGYAKKPTNSSPHPRHMKTDETENLFFYEYPFNTIGCMCVYGGQSSGSPL
jgi:hypothetical protein